MGSNYYKVLSATAPEHVTSTFGDTRATAITCIKVVSGTLRNEPFMGWLTSPLGITGDQIDRVSERLTRVGLVVRADTVDAGTHLRIRLRAAVNREGALTFATEALDALNDICETSIRFVLVESEI